MTTTPSHTWRFSRAGGFDQVRLDRAVDLASLDQLDQKLWVALACPVGGLEFDERTLKLIDTDSDGRIRAPEVIAAAKWAVAHLKDPEQIVTPSSALPLSAINDATPEGKTLLASAKQILSNLGKPTADSITVEDTTDTAKIFAATRFNGDGVIPADATDDAFVRGVIDDILKTLPPLADRSAKPGVDAKTVEKFFADCQAFSDWHAAAEAAGSSILPLGKDGTPTAAAAINAVQAKVDDYFARCRLAAYDTRSTAALNRKEEDYLAIAAHDLTITSAEIAILPLSKIEAGKSLPLADGLNPAWVDAIATLGDSAVGPLLGQHSSLTDADWNALKSRFADYRDWLAKRPATAVESLGVTRVREILASPARAAIADLLAKDFALAPEAAAIGDVDRLVRYNRDLHKLVHNFVNFRDFYARLDKAIFQVGTLYLDQRSCDLCIRVEDAARHGAMAHLSYAYLAYCDVVRKSSGEKMTILAAFTAGDSDNLMVGRNGIFYDRKGRDWDATITKIVDNPISIRQAFWAPYKRAVRWIEEQIAKRAAAADAAAHTQMTASMTAAVDQPPPPPPPAGAPPAPPKKMDVGVVAALGVAVGAITTALGIFLNWLSGTPWYFLPLYIALVMLAISLPSMIIAALKLRQRNLGPILDANGWAVNARARINIPFGRVLTKTRQLPPGSKRDLVDPYADSHAGRHLIIFLLILAAALWALWYFGLVEKVAPNVFPKSSYYERTHGIPTTNP